MFRGLVQPWHLVVILAVVLILFGPGKLAGLGGALGKSIRDFKDGIRSVGKSEPEPSTFSSSAESQSAGQLRVCAACNTENAAANRFCASCGKELA